MFTDFPFLDRFELAARLGFKAVEFHSPYEYAPEELLRCARDTNVSIVLFNSITDERAFGGNGIASIPGHESEFLESVHKALYYADELNCTNVHVLSGSPPDSITRSDAYDVYLNNIRMALRLFDQHATNLLIEPLNTYDNPGYFLPTTEQVVSVIEQLNHSRVWMLFDFYHCQLMTGNLTHWLARSWHCIAHMQAANVPGRTSLEVGEINYDYILSRVDSLGFRGWFGFEFHNRFDSYTAF